MGLFDKNKTGAGVADHPTQEQQLETLKSRYQSVLNTIQQQGVRLQNLHVEEGKLVIRGEAPSTEAKDRVWDQIKLVNPSANDIVADITVSPSATSPASLGTARGAGRTYTVKSGDTLSKIAKDFYGNANDYHRIFEANRDKLTDPDKIQPGQELRIP